MLHGDALSLLEFAGNTITERFNNCIDSIIDIIGPEGNLFIPVFTYSSGRDEIFNPEVSPSRVGGFSNLALKSGRFKRTIDPMFSWLVLGPFSQSIQTKIYNSAFGEGSFFAEIEELNLKVLLSGVPLSKGFTYIHRIEQRNKVNYRFNKYFESVVQVKDKKKRFRYEYFVRELHDDYKCNLSKISEELIEKEIVKFYNSHTDFFIIDCNIFEQYFIQNIENNPNMLISKND